MRKSSALHCATVGNLTKICLALIAHFVSFYIYSQCVSIPKKCTRRDKYIVTKESFSPVSELYTTVMSLVINSQELDNLSPHLSYLISAFQLRFFCKMAHFKPNCLMHSLQLEFTTKGTINVFVSTTYIYNTVFSSTCVFKIYKPSISISITRNRYRNDHFRKLPTLAIFECIF